MRKVWLLFLLGAVLFAGCTTGSGGAAPVLPAYEHQPPDGLLRPYPWPTDDENGADGDEPAYPNETDNPFDENENGGENGGENGNENGNENGEYENGEYDDPIILAYPPEMPEIDRIRRDLDPDKPMVALTFDDGPVNETAAILDILEYHGVRATFCVIGMQLGAYQGVVRRAFDAGHEIIGHSWSHRDMTTLNAAEIRAEILSTYYAITAITGYSPQMFRPPFGHWNSTVRNVALELEFSILMWSVDTRDWETRDADLIFGHFLTSFDGAIVIAHDWVNATACALNRAIPELLEQGFQLVTVSELFYYAEITPQPGEIYRRG